MKKIFLALLIALPLLWLGGAAAAAAEPALAAPTPKPTCVPGDPLCSPTPGTADCTDLTVTSCLNPTTSPSPKPSKPPKKKEKPKPSACELVPLPGDICIPEGPNAGDPNASPYSGDPDTIPRTSDCLGKSRNLDYCQFNPDDNDDDDTGSAWDPRNWPTKMITALGEAFGTASVKMIKFMSSWWIAMDSPDLSEKKDSPIVFMQNSTKWLTGFTVALGLLFVAGRTAWERRGEPLRQALSGLVTLIVVSGVAVVALNLAIKAGDVYSEAVWNAGEKVDMSEEAKALYGAAALRSIQSPTIVIILGLLVILSGLIQFALMMLRALMLVILVGILPLAAAASITQDGRAWLRKLLGWLLAYLLYKPVCATLYGVAFMMMKTGDEWQVLQGLMLIILSVLALPALMRFIAPMTGAASGGGGGGAAALAGLAALGARASGAGGGGGAPSGARQIPPPDSAVGADPTGGETPGRQPTNTPPSNGQTNGGTTPGDGSTTGGPASTTGSGSTGGPNSTGAGSTTTGGGTTDGGSTPGSQDLGSGASGAAPAGGGRTAPGVPLNPTTAAFTAATGAQAGLQTAVNDATGAGEGPSGSNDNR